MAFSFTTQYHTMEIYMIKYILFQMLAWKTHYVSGNKESNIKMSVDIWNNEFATDI